MVDLRRQNEELKTVRTANPEAFRNGTGGRRRGQEEGHGRSTNGLAGSRADQQQADMDGG